MIPEGHYKQRIRFIQERAAQQSDNNTDRRRKSQILEKGTCLETREVFVVFLFLCVPSSRLPIIFICAALQEAEVQIPSTTTAD